jgi:hypothetical protein
MDGFVLSQGGGDPGMPTEKPGEVLAMPTRRLARGDTGQARDHVVLGSGQEVVRRTHQRARMIPHPAPEFGQRRSKAAPGVERGVVPALEVPDHSVPRVKLVRSMSAGSWLFRIT